MQNRNKGKHHSQIIDQFSRQAIPFTQVPGHYDAMQVFIHGVPIAVYVGTKP